MSKLKVYIISRMWHYQCCKKRKGMNIDDCSIRLSCRWWDEEWDDFKVICFDYRAKKGWHMRISTGEDWTLRNEKKIVSKNFISFFFAHTRVERDMRSALQWELKLKHAKISFSLIPLMHTKPRRKERYSIIDYVLLNSFAINIECDGFSITLQKCNGEKGRQADRRDNNGSRNDKTKFFFLSCSSCLFSFCRKSEENVSGVLLCENRKR